MQVGGVMLPEYMRFGGVVGFDALVGPGWRVEVPPIVGAVFGATDFELRETVWVAMAAGVVDDVLVCEVPGFGESGWAGFPDWARARARQIFGGLLNSAWCTAECGLELGPWAGNTNQLYGLTGPVGVRSVVSAVRLLGGRFACGGVDAQWVELADSVTGAKGDVLYELRTVQAPVAQVDPGAGLSGVGVSGLAGEAATSALDGVGL
jgi:hypothetical protein